LSDHARSVLIWAPLGLLLSLQVLVQRSMISSKLTLQEVGTEDDLPDDVVELEKELGRLNAKTKKFEQNERKTNFISWSIAALLLFISFLWKLRFGELCFTHTSARVFL
jgi:hypothetical protein